jgi:hypothetical protein
MKRRFELAALVTIKLMAMNSYLIFLFAILLSTPSYSQSFREQFTEANLLTEDGYYGVAIPIWEDLLREKTNANINYKLGSSYLNLGIDRDRALPYLLNAAKDIQKTYDPFSSDFKSAPTETYFYLAEAYHISGNIDSSELYYQKFLDQASKKQYLRPKASRGLEMCDNARELMANPVDVKITNIGAPINSPFAEYLPIVAYDENTLYFTSRRLRSDGSNDSKIEVTTGMYYEDMYVSFRSISGNWMEPELLNINAIDAHSSAVSMSADSRRIYISKTFSGNGNIYESEFIFGTGWTEPELVGSNVNSQDNEFFATITADEQRLYFVSDRSGGLGGKDIWCSNKLHNGEWGKAINMGAPINTAGDEDAPYLHPDGKTMYFSSNGHKSMGGYDIFYSQFENNEWTSPTNLGYPINTTDDDQSYISTPDGNRAYYSRKGANTVGSTDIYVVEYPVEENDRPKVDFNVFALVKGWVFPAPNQVLPAELEILIRDNETNEIKGQAKPVERNGSFVFIVPVGSSCEVTLNIEDDQLYKERIDIPEGKVYQELSREIFLTPSDGKVKAIAIDDKVLGNLLKWRLSFKDDSKAIPLGSMVYYLDKEEQVIDSSYVSKDGYFEYKKLDPRETYILKPSLSLADTLSLEINSINNKDNVAPKMSRQDQIFYEEGKAPKPIERVATQNSLKTQDEPTEGQKDQPQSKKEKFDTKTTVEKSLIPSDSKVFYIYFDYNVASNIPLKEIKTITTAIANELNSKGKASISLEGCASTLSANRKGGNQEMAALRLKFGKAALMKQLKADGLDISKISIMREESIVSGPENVNNPEVANKKHIDFQYFKVQLN